MNSAEIRNRYRESESLLERALRVIPLGSQTFSKSITAYPRGVAPLYIARGKGSHVWDVDDNEYIDFVNALASVVIGYNDREVTRAVQEQIEHGVTFSLPHPLETEIAEMLAEMVPCAEMVRFAKNGTDATSAAVRLARAYTGREHVLVCGYHGWQDWYIGSTTRNLGVPRAVQELTHKFQYNKPETLTELFDAHRDRVAAVIMEPMNVAFPEDHFLEYVKRQAHRNGALLIFDETITGCRFAKGGAQEYFGVVPDLATFGKGLANGFPLSAVLGRADVMRLMEDIFFSGTFSGETASLAAAKVVLAKVRDGDVIEKLAALGESVFRGVGTLIAKHGVDHIFRISGHPSWSFLHLLDNVPYTSWQIKTLFLQETFARGILTLGTHNMSYAHTLKDIECLLDVYDAVFPIIRDAVAERSLEVRLRTEPLQPLFKIR